MKKNIPVILKPLDLTQYDIIIICDKYNYFITSFLKFELEKYGFKIYISSKILDTSKLQIITSYKFLENTIDIKLDNYIICNFDNINYLDIDNNYYRNSKIILDYNKYNLNNLPNDIKEISKIQIIPLSYEFINDSNIYNSNIYDQTYDQAYDIIFIGEISNRRKNILSKLNNNFKIKVIYENLGREYNDYITKTKIIFILNKNITDNTNIAELNYYLKYNKLILCEKSRIIYDGELDDYKDDIIFFDNILDNMSNINNIINQLNISLKNYDHFSDQIDFIRQNTIYNLYNKFKLSLIKNLISLDLINYKTYNIDIDKQIICMYHAEESDKIDHFKKFNTKFIEHLLFFDMIRNKNKINEIVLSYKLLFNNFLKTNKQFLITCNINSILPQNFSQYNNKILNYMKQNNLDIFVGNVDKFYDTAILKTDNKDHITYTHFKNSNNINNLFNTYNIFSRNIIEILLKEKNMSFNLPMITINNKIFNTIN